MKLSDDALEALILVAGFAVVAAAGLIVFLVWPTNVHGNWRVYLTLVIGAAIVIPAMIALRRRLTGKPDGDPE
jgi:cytochrome c biogenesis protein CcdA